MRSPDELGSIDWSALEHAYGPADDVPELIRGLYSTRGDEFEGVCEELAGCIFHQGSLYSATAEAVPFLAHAAVNLPERRDQVVFFLVMLADESSPGADPDEIRVRAAVQAELSAVVASCLADPDEEVRRASVRLAAMAARPAPAWLVEALDDAYENDPSSRITADALTALALLCPGEEREHLRRVAALSGEKPEVRLASALVDLGSSTPPYPPGLLSVVGLDGAAALTQPTVPFPGAPEDRLHELLLADPDGALTVAENWVAVADPPGRGSWLARNIVNTWRDTERRVVALMMQAFPKHTDPLSFSSRLGEVAFWMPYAGPQSEETRQILLEQTTHKDPQAADAAYRALAGMGELTILGDGYNPSAWALAILLTHHRRAALPRIAPALSRAFVPGRVNQLLVDALQPEDVTGLGSELKNLLRTRGCEGTAARTLALAETPLDQPDHETVDLLAAEFDNSNAWVRVGAAVAHARLTRSMKMALPVIKPFMRQVRLPNGLLPHVGRLGPIGAPLLGDLERLMERSDLTGAEAADAHWRIAADADVVLAPLTRLAQMRRQDEYSLTAIRALSTLGDIGRPPTSLHAELQRIALSRRRATRPGGPVELPHRDERMRRDARRLLGLDTAARTPG